MASKPALLNWLAEDDLQKVFQGLFSLAYKYKNEQLRSDATLQSGRFKGLEKQRLNSTISQEEDHLQRAKIRQALLQIIQNLSDDWTLEGMGNTPVSAASLSNANWKKYAAYFVAAIALLAGIAELSGYSLRDYLKKNDTTEIPAEIQPPAPKASTTGDQSPAIITDDGDVNINYGDSKSKKDSTHITQNPQK